MDKMHEVRNVLNKYLGSHSMNALRVDRSIRNS